MAQKQDPKSVLLCTHEDCQEIQAEDGEFCIIHSRQKKYNIFWDRNDCGVIEIRAKSEKEARNKFEMGDYQDRNLEIQDGDIRIVDITEA